MHKPCRELRREGPLPVADVDGGDDGTGCVLGDERRWRALGLGEQDESVCDALGVFGAAAGVADLDRGDVVGGDPKEWELARGVGLWERAGEQNG